MRTKKWVPNELVFVNNSVFYTIRLVPTFMSLYTIVEMYKDMKL